MAYQNQADFQEKSRENEKRIEEALNDFSSLYSDKRFKDFWARTKDIIELFKTAKPLDKDARERLWQRYQGIIMKAKEEQEQFRAKQEENANILERELTKLEFDHLVPNMPFSSKNYYFGDFWRHCKSVNQMFRDHPTVKDKRETLWSKYQSICREVEAYQKNEQADVLHNFNEISDILSDAYNKVYFASGADSLKEGNDLCNRVMELLRERRLYKSEREKCFNRWKDIKNNIASKRSALQFDEMARAEGEISTVSDRVSFDNPYEAQKEVQALQKSLYGFYLNREQRQELRNRLQELWEICSRRIGEVKDDKRRKHEEWASHMEENISRWENRINESEKFIDRLNDQIRDCENMDVRSSDFQEKVDGWIREKHEKINEVNEQIRELNEKIRDVRDKLQS